MIELRTIIDIAAFFFMGYLIAKVSYIQDAMRHMGDILADHLSGEDEKHD
jgi:hypothetical protein